MQQDMQHTSRQLTLTWLGLLTGVIIIGAVMYWLPYQPALDFPGGPLWWLAILLPVAPALVLRQQARVKERDWRREPAKAQELRIAFMLCWSLADMPVMLGAPVGMISGQPALILGGMAVSIALLLFSRPDGSRHV